MTLSAPDTERSAAGEVETVDAVAVGAGFAGLYMLYELRRQGLTVRVLEAGDDVGGTSYWTGTPVPAPTARATTTRTHSPPSSRRTGTGRNATRARRNCSAT